MGFSRRGSREREAEKRYAGGNEEKVIARRRIIKTADRIPSFFMILYIIKIIACSIYLKTSSPLISLKSRSRSESRLARSLSLAIISATSTPPMKCGKRT